MNGMITALVSAGLITTGAANALAAPDTPNALPAPAHQPTPPRVANSPGDWIGNDAYPATALKAGAHGDTHFMLTVGLTGLPVACAITATSGNAELDAKTCSELMANARFVAARDGDGKATTGTYRSSVKWDLPDVRYNRFEPTPYKVDYDVEPDGMVNHCNATPAGGFQICTVMGQVTPYLGVNGKPARKHVTLTINVDVTDKP